MTTTIAVPSDATFNLALARIAALETKLAAQALQLAALQAADVLDEATIRSLQAAIAGDEANIAALQAIVAGIAPPPIIPPPPPPPPPSGVVLFSSEWASGAPKDTWDEALEFNNGTGVTLMSVVPSGLPAHPNALKVLQRGSQLAANLRKWKPITPGQDFYVRYYFKTDDTSGAGDHIVTCELYHYPNLTYLRKMGGPTSFQPILSAYNQESHYLYPIGHWFLRDRLANGTFWRFEYFVHWTDPTHLQVQVRIYDATGILRYTEADYQQSDFGGSAGLSWGGRADWTLASYQAEPRHADGYGHDFLVDPLMVAEFGLGNNGQAGAVDTGLAWYFAGVRVQTGDWCGA